MRRLNIGCGPYKREDYINIDINPRQSPDILRDITRGLPFDDSSVDHIVASHFLEHLEVENFMWVLEECYRVLKPEAAISVVVPLMEFTTLDHKMFFTEDSFEILFRDADVYFNRRFRWRCGSKRVEPRELNGRSCDILEIDLHAVK